MLRRLIPLLMFVVLGCRTSATNFSPVTMALEALCRQQLHSEANGQRVYVRDTTSSGLVTGNVLIAGRILAGEKPTPADFTQSEEAAAQTVAQLTSVGVTLPANSDCNLTLSRPAEVNSLLLELSAPFQNPLNSSSNSFVVVGHLTLDQQAGSWYWIELERTPPWVVRKVERLPIDD